MPVFVDPKLANPPPPEVVVSPDGRLTATVRPGGEGVFLEADFTDYPSDPGRDIQILRRNVAPPYESPSQWGAGGGATNTLDSSWSVAGGQSIKVTPAGQVTSAVYPYGVVVSMNGHVPGRTYTASATIRLTAAQTGSLHDHPRAIVVANVNNDGEVNLGYAISEPAPNEPGVHRVSVTYTVAARTTGMYFRLMNGSTTVPVWWDGLMVEEGTEATTPYFDGDTSDPESVDEPHYRWAVDGRTSEEYLPAVATVSQPPWVRVERAAGGEWVPIFSGDPAASPGGYGVAYDMFAPLGQPISYRATPLTLSGDPAGEASESVAVVLPAPTKWGNRRRVTWLKSAREPSLSMRVQAAGEPPEFAREGRTNLQPVPGTSFLAGSSDVQQARMFTLDFLTEDQSEQEQMEELLTSGTLLVQTPSAWQLGDMWVEPGSVTMRPQARMDTGAHRWTVEFTQVGQPSTADTPLVVPGRSWQWAAETHTWASLDATYDDWLSVVKP